jgi:hypothetical protein
VGSFVAQVTIHRGITLPSAEVHDCAPENCVVAVTSAGQTWASAEIEFVDTVVLAAAVSPATVYPLAQSTSTVLSSASPVRSTRRPPTSTSAVSSRSSMMTV